MARPTPFAAAPGGVVVTVRLTPKASSCRIGPVARDAAGTAMLKVAVNEPAENGKANKALVGLLAKAWKLPKSALRIRRGAKDRTKTLFVEGPTEALLERMEASL